MTGPGPCHEGDASWRPSAEMDALHARADAQACIRAFFADRGLLEVTTPLLGRHTIPDPNIPSIPAAPSGQLCWLQTSPEFAMKRLLAAGSGDIFQICPAFREGELGEWHNPEFTLLEWYRTGWDDRALAGEVAELIQKIFRQPFSRSHLGNIPVERVSYAEAFQRHAGVDPLEDDEDQIAEAAIQILGAGGPSDWSRGDWLDLIGASRVYPALGRGVITIVEDFPADQAALARVREGNTQVAARFEVVFEGIELANGFFELADSEEQRRRFKSERALRQARGLADVEPDGLLLAALESGLPEVSGVAMGFDRLLALALGMRSIAPVLSFSWDRI